MISDVTTVLDVIKYGIGCLFLLGVLWIILR